MNWDELPELGSSAAGLSMPKGKTVRKQTYAGIENRHHDLPHSWECKPAAVIAKRGRYEDYERLKKEWLHQNPCAGPEDITRAFRKIADELGI